MEFRINLQIFAEEKTEQPTPKKRQKTREEGQVLHSKEVNTALTLVGAFVMLYLLSGFIGASMKSFTVHIYQQYLNLNYLFSLSNLQILWIRSMYYIFIICMPIAFACLIIGLISSYYQVGYLFTVKPLAIKFDKLNPAKGLKNMFSLKKIVELIKSFVKIFAVGLVVYHYALGQLNTIFNLVAMDLNIIVKTVISIVFHMGLRAGIVLSIIGILDYYYQKYEYEKNIKMTKQEVKEEYKQTEGNPQIKSKIKEKQRQMALRRMMQDVPKADVIITNPTHFAVAIQYAPDQFEAPRVVAKGQDLIAQNIKKIAGENGVSIIENKPLARTLYETVEIGELIPPELYQAVAEILAYVYQLKNKTKGGTR